MMWRDVQTTWAQTIEQITARWPETKRDYLIAIAGDKHLFVGHLADMHDLTLSEAAEEVEDWLWVLASAECRYPEDRRILVAE